MKRILKALGTLTVAFAIFIPMARLLFPLPDISTRENSVSIPAETETNLGASFIDAAAQQPSLSGVIPLQNGHDALASRVELAVVAQRSIDAQYYIWQDDTSGIMLLNGLYQAAQRGVRVRLLLDDNGVSGMDSFMAALNAQPNFEIRLFNPSTVRTPKLLGYAFDFFRMNRRMHNKSFIVDGAIAIIGGRNIGDEYFEVGDDNFYLDMDVLATGAVVPETADMFDAYWNSASVFGVETIIEGDGDLGAFEARVEAVLASDEADTLLGELQDSVERYANGEISMEWTTVQLMADNPAKGQGIATAEQLLVTQIEEILATAENRLDVVSAYFVPGVRGTTSLTNLADTGVDISILTNALNTTDVLLVHAGYTRYRRELLEADISLYELKLRADMTSEAELQILPFGLSGASLHAKTFAIDDSRLFIGSFNFDPRSATLNCEMGFLIDSPTLARQASEGFDGPLDVISYQPQLTPEEKMVWLEVLEDGETVIYQEEPGASWFQQIAFAVLGFFPIEWLL